MQVIYVRQKGFIPALIRWFDGGYYNHCVVVDNNNWAYEADAGTPVHVRSIFSVKNNCISYMVLDVPVHDETAATWFAKKQLGMTYDYGAIFGLFIKKIFGTAPNIQAKSRWFCDELVLATLIAGGAPMPSQPLRAFGVQHSLEYILEKCGATVVEKHTNPIL